MKHIAVYGDSIAFGFGNGNTSWFDMLPSTHPKVKFAFNGAQVGDVLSQIMLCKEEFETLYLAVGVNDLFALNSYRFEHVLAKYKEVVDIAKKLSPQIFIQALLPVIDCASPKQAWTLDTDPINPIIVDFNQKLQALAEEKQCVFVDAFSEFTQLNLPLYYDDDVHLNKLGQLQLLKVYTKYA